MNKTYLCVLPLTLILAASSGYSVAAGNESDPKCKGDPQAPMVNINLNTKKAKPECVRAQLGEPIVFRLTPKKDVKDLNVKIVPADALKDSWLQGKNDDYDDLIIIRVPGVYDPMNDREFTDHEYIIMVGGDEIDPRVEVEK